MKAPLMILFSMLGLGGCRENDLIVERTDAGQIVVDGQCPKPADMTSLGLNCPAASGLVGDRLICVDFSQISSLSDPALVGWDFMSIGGNCWTPTGGKLHVNTPNFPTYMGTCGFFMRPLTSVEYGKYNSFTLSVVHTMDINDTAQQKAQVMLGQDDPQNRLIDQTTGKQPRKQWVHTLAKGSLPNGSSNSYQPLFKLSAPLTAGGNSQGWQIESIAIIGNP